MEKPEFYSNTFLKKKRFRESNDFIKKLISRNILHARTHCVEIILHARKHFVEI